MAQQLTVNVPTVTAAAQIRGRISEVLEELKLELATTDYKHKKPPAWKRLLKLHRKKSANSPEFESPWGPIFPHYSETSENLDHEDKMIAYEVRLLLEQVMDLDFSCWSEAEQRDYLELELLQVSLQETNLVTDAFF